MEEHFDGLLKRWSSSLRPAEKKAIYGDGAGVFIGFRQMKVEIDFLDACVEYWDPKLHLFRFPGGEVCPLMEEFAAIAGWSKRTTPVVVQNELCFNGRLRNFLGMTTEHANGIFEGGKVNMLRVCARYMNRADSSISDRSRRRALSFCLVHRYAFAGTIPDGIYGNAKYARVVEEMERGHDPSAIILAETILGLDDRRANRLSPYRGCARILQVWLMERLSVLAPLPRDCVFKPAAATSRKHEWVVPRERSFNYFRGFVRERTIRWTVSWWRISSVTAPSVANAAHGLMLCGFERGVWIHPLRVRRQIGLAQMIPEQDSRVGEVVVLNNQTKDAWARGWSDRVTWAVPNEIETTRVSDFYKRWCSSEDPRERANQRRREKIGPKPSLAHEVVRGKRDYGFLQVSSDGASSSKPVRERLGPRVTVKDRLGARIEEPPVAKDEDPIEPPGFERTVPVIASVVVADPPLEDEEANPKRRKKT